METQAGGLILGIPIDVFRHSIEKQFPNSPLSQQGQAQQGKVTQPDLLLQKNNSKTRAATHQTGRQVARRLAKTPTFRLLQTMHYFGNIWRPPSEANSLIIQASLGCQHNACLFCGMYRDKKFALRPPEQVCADIQEARLDIIDVKRIFLADGNALAIPTNDLLKILACIKQTFPECRRVSCYATPADLYRLHMADLAVLHSAGLALLYIGLESGSDAVLAFVNKGNTANQARDGCVKAKSAGFALSTMLISGLGGAELSSEHADASASLVNAIQPDYLSLLSLMIDPAAPLTKLIEHKRFQPLAAQEVLSENRRLVEQLELERCVFAANHASNYLALSGRLPEDKNRLLAQLNQALVSGSRLRQEWQRGL